MYLFKWCFYIEHDTATRIYTKTAYIKHARSVSGYP